MTWSQDLRPDALAFPSALNPFPYPLFLDTCALVDPITVVAYRSPLRDDHQGPFPQALLSLLTQLNSHGVLSSRQSSSIRREDNNSTSLATTHPHVDLRKPPEN